MLKYYTMYLHMTVKSGVRHMRNSESLGYKLQGCELSSGQSTLSCGLYQNMVPLKTATNNCNSSLIFSAVLVAALYLQAATRTEM